MKLLESHIKITLLLAKYNMVPEQVLGKDMASGLVMHMPDPHDFFDTLEKGSIKLNSYEVETRSNNNKVAIMVDNRAAPDANHVIAHYVHHEDHVPQFIRHRPEFVHVIFNDSGMVPGPHVHSSFPK
ncbi:dimethylaniline monooxygenase, N-oxide-forming [Artemisia annua]|uniref:Dimethylaniline monooxygenase, N-oxide-forming n=1 Tax=Artemisia annua TaxID=35608 RepID=A0A2U1PRY8_ARTAN|nr:dimethylaniline monooxygenase, N-oxide-forming [Artemisia annua]